MAVVNLEKIILKLKMIVNTNALNLEALLFVSSRKWRVLAREVTRNGTMMHR